MVHKSSVLHRTKGLDLEAQIAVLLAEVPQKVRAAWVTIYQSQSDRCEVKIVAVSTRLGILPVKYETANSENPANSVAVHYTMDDLVEPVPFRVAGDIIGV